ncbi:hypothetical protein [Spiroplasma phoeniceum]|uniref:hypothetical protein n=1 Tax=Spiroplasma phoeniceum TaxID=47835 RepID=UPI003364DF35
MTINKSLGAEQRPSKSGTSSILNKIDNYLDETETQEDKGSNELEDSILPLIISEIDKYFESSEGEWVLLKNEINKNFDRRERIEAGLKNEIDNYFRNRGSVSASLRDKINQYFSDKEIQSKSIWKKCIKIWKNHLKL